MNKKQIGELISHLNRIALNTNDEKTQNELNEIINLLWLD